MEKQATVLVVEDDSRVRELLTRALADEHNVLVAAHGAEAFSIAETNPIDVVVTDVVLPGIDGPELVSQLRSLQPSVRVLYISGWEADERVGRLDAPVLEKPFDLGELRTRVSELLAG